MNEILGDESLQVDNHETEDEPVHQSEEESDYNSEDEINGWNRDPYWYNNSTVPPFDQKAKAVYEFSLTDTPLTFFSHLFTPEILDLIVEQTNLYADQKESKNWVPTTRQEMGNFLAIQILMGIHVLPSIRCYWSSNPLIGVQPIQRIMSLKRYEAILSNLHCNDNTKCPAKGEPNYDKLYKLRPVIDKVNNSLLMEYIPSSHQSIDESMIAFKGRCSIKQYMPLKPIKRGYKVWARADSETGYMCEFQVYTGRSDSGTEYQLGERVVLDLTKNISQSLCLVTFDNFFTSISLMNSLYCNGVYACGTVRTNRKDLPLMMTSKTKSLPRGSYKWRTNNNVTAVQWQDNRTVNIISTAHDPVHVTTVKRTQKDGKKQAFTCPLAVLEYNSYMGGVDKSDQLRQYYEMSRKSRKWWIKIMYFMVDICIINSFILFNLTRKKFQREEITQLDYRLRLVSLLSSSRTMRKKSGAVAYYLTNKKKSPVPEEVRLSGVGKHLPVSGPTYRRCKLCSTRANEKRSKIICSGCQVPLCASPCFQKFHTARTM